MRLFIAVDVSEEVRHYLRNLQQDVAKLPAKQSLAKDFHLTLKFLGEVTPQQAEEVKVRLQKVSCKPFTATLDGIGVFPSEDSVRVVWVGLSPKETIMALQKQIDEALQGLFTKEKQFVPHITLSRVKAITDKAVFAKQLEALEVKPLSFPVTQFALIQATLRGKEGPLYEKLGVYSG